MTDLQSTNMTRRAVLCGCSAAALMPGAVAAQGTPSFIEFAAQARSATGFDAIPRAFLREVFTSFGQDQIRSFVREDSRSDGATKSILKTLYTGQHSPPNEDPTRFAYSDALMFAVIEDTVNVPSYCGGLPGYWAEKPQTV